MVTSLYRVYRDLRYKVVVHPLSLFVISQTKLVILTLSSRHREILATPYNAHHKLREYMLYVKEY